MKIRVREWTIVLEAEGSIDAAKLEKAAQELKRAGMIYMLHPPGRTMDSWLAVIVEKPKGRKE